MTKPTIILDPHWRTLDELFSDRDRRRLFAEYTVVWGRDAPIPPAVLRSALPKASVLIAANPVADSETFGVARALKAIIEVSGSFPGSIDYAASSAAGVEVLSCAPGFRRSVAEMGLAMALAGARGLVTEHENFRNGHENWLSDNADTDFTLFNASIGFVGFGQIAQELCRLLSPFSPDIRAYDPWLADADAATAGAKLASLDEVMAKAQCLFVAAIPTAENRGMIDAGKLTLMPHGALLVLLSRAHLVDFEAVLSAVEAGRIRAAIDVFPSEPVAPNHPMRSMGNLILSPHRAAAVSGGRHLIGEMILDDLAAIFDGDPKRRLAVADKSTIRSLAGVGDADKLRDMAEGRRS